MRRTLSILGGLGLGLTLSQFPEYIQQYEQRLGGAVDQLQAVIQDFDRSADKAGLSRAEALQVYQRSPDRFLVDRGLDMTKAFARYDRLSAHLAALQQAGPVEHVIDFARYYDPQIGERALAAYDPAVPATPEGIAYAGGGIVLGYGLVALILSLLAAPLRHRNRVRITPQR